MFVQALNWVLVGSGLVALVVAAKTPLASEQETAVPFAMGVNEEPSSVYRPDSLAAVVVSHDVFRLSRTAANVSYDPQANRDQSEIPYDQMQTPRPVLTLVGLVNAERPTALVEGIPNHTGARVVWEGDRIAGLLINSIRDGRVEIVGVDTVWVLTLREPWN